MRIIISPAKQMREDRDTLPPRGLPGFLPETGRLLTALRNLSPADRGNELQFVLFTINNDRMTGVVASLAAHHKIGVCRKDVDEFAFAFVAPLSA